MLDVLGEQMAKLLSLGLQVALVLDGSARYQWNALFNHYARRLDRRHLLRVVGEQANTQYSELEEHCNRWPVIPRVYWQTQGTICADGIMIGVLQSIGAYLVSEADPSTLLSAQIDQDPRTRLDDPPQRFIQLGTTITAQRAQGLAGYAFRMNSHERRAYLAQPKTHKSEVFVAVRSGKRMSAEQPVLGRKSTGRDALHVHALLRP